MSVSRSHNAALEGGDNSMKKHLFIDGGGWKLVNIGPYSRPTAGNKLLRSRMQDVEVSERLEAG